MKAHLFKQLPLFNRRKEITGTEQKDNSGQKGRTTIIAIAILPGKSWNLVMTCCKMTLRKHNNMIPKIVIYNVKGKVMLSFSCCVMQIICNAVPSMTTSDSSTSTHK